MLERFKLLYEKFENTNSDSDEDVVNDNNDEDVVNDNSDEEEFSLLKSPYKIYLLIFLISIIIVFLIIILVFTPSSYNQANIQPYNNQNRIY